MSLIITQNNNNIEESNSSENVCKKCNKKFSYNYLLIRHQTRKTSCIPKEIRTELNIVGLDDKIKEIEITIDKKCIQSLKSKKSKCYLCNTLFSNKSNLSRHISNFCSKKKQMLNEKKNLFLSKKNLQEKISLNLMTTNNKQNNVQNISIENNTNIVFNIIQIYSYDEREQKLNNKFSDITNYKIKLLFYKTIIDPELKGNDDNIFVFSDTNTKIRALSILLNSNTLNKFINKEIIFFSNM